MGILVPAVMFGMLVFSTLGVIVLLITVTEMQRRIRILEKRT